MDRNTQHARQTFANAPQGECVRYRSGARVSATPAGRSRLGGFDMKVWIAERILGDNSVEMLGVFDSEDAAKAMYGNDDTVTYTAMPVLSLWNPVGGSQ
jgi:hypothetical protein